MLSCREFNFEFFTGGGGNDDDTDKEVANLSRANSMNSADSKSSNLSGLIKANAVAPLIQGGKESASDAEEEDKQQQSKNSTTG